jgi:hypothetical protein
MKGRIVFHRNVALVLLSVHKFRVTAEVDDQPEGASPGWIGTRLPTGASALRLMKVARKL